MDTLVTVSIHTNRLTRIHTKQHNGFAVLAIGTVDVYVDSEEKAAELLNAVRTLANDCEFRS